MVCPYCGGSDDFDNSNLNHKIKHNTCKKYFKLCPTCNTKYVDSKNDIVESENVIKAENLFDVNKCSVCHQSWLPDFPTSWTRSLTNIGKIYEVINDLSAMADKSITTNNLFKIQSTHNGVIYNPLRAESRGVQEYIGGAGKRRMAEYLSYFLNAQIVKTNYYDKKPVKEMTKFGEEFSSTRNNSELIAYFIASFSNIKINNGYQKPKVTSVYQYFKIRFLENILEVAQVKKDKGEIVSPYDFGVSVLARDRDEFKEYSLDYIENFNSDGLKNIFFSNSNKELRRAVISTFVNVFISLGLLIKRRDGYEITELGSDVLEFLKERPAIWYEDTQLLDQEDTVVSAKLILWRLVKHGVVKEEDLVKDCQMVESELADMFHIDIASIKDIHFNLYYDEPSYKHNITTTTPILLELRSLIKEDKMTIEEIKESCEYLPVLWYFDLYEVVMKHETLITRLVNDFDEGSLKNDLQSGKKWHNKAREAFKKMGLDCIDYQSNPLFSKITIDKLNLNLPGTTIYNPDLLIMDEKVGKENCILVDAKDENSINSEVHKLMGYNLYSKDSRVNTYCIIALRGKLPTITKSRIDNNINEFDRIVIIEEKAIELLVEKNYTKRTIEEILRPTHGFKYIDLDYVLDYSKNIKLVADRTNKYS